MYFFHLGSQYEDIYTYLPMCIPTHIRVILHNIVLKILIISLLPKIKSYTLGPQNKIFFLFNNGTLIDIPRLATTIFFTRDFRVQAPNTSSGT